jgi:hypothetical protein
VKKVQTNLALIGISAVLWLAVWQLNQLFFPFAMALLDANIIYLPAGMRLLLILALRLWGAIGVSIGAFIATLTVIGSAGPVNVVLALISGFMPLFTVMGVQRYMGISKSLAELKGWHIPLLALACAVTSAFASSLAHLYFETDSTSFMLRFATKAVGNFLGTWAILLALRVGVVWWRRSQEQAR